MVSRARLVPVLLFGSGFCALIYQTTWLREFRLVFGASTAASAAVLGVFMAGLGFGGIILGRRSQTADKPLAFYARLELFIALGALVSVPLIWIGREVYIAIGGTPAIGVFVGTVVRLLLASAILGPPTFLMGGTLPAVARAVVAPEDESRRAVGLLYGINTLGAVTGTVVSTFYLFERLGNRLTLVVAAGLNILVALLAFQISKNTPEPRSERKSHREARSADEKRVPAAFVFAAAWLVGFSFLLLELIWYRMLAPLLGGTTFSFGLILGVALLGIGLGGTVYSFFGLRRSASLQVFALTCAFEAFFVALPYALGDRIAVAVMLLRPLGAIGFAGHVIAWTAISLIVIFPAAFISGLQFPLLIALLGKGRRDVAVQTGAAYAWNTIGALIGSLTGGFGLLPLCSAQGAWKIVIALLGLLAVIAAVFALRESFDWQRLVGAFVAAAAAMVMITALGPTAFWRHSEIGVGRLKAYGASPNELKDIINTMRRRTIWQKDGVETGVAMIDTDALAFIVNGRSDGSAKHDAGTQIMSGLLGVALHPNPKKALVIGLGTGSTAGWLAATPGINKVDAIELEPAVLEVARACAPVNRNALTNPKLQVRIGDGRELMLTTPEKYDLIVSEPSNPFRAGVANLFTIEYYRSVDRILNTDGMFFQWVQAYDIDNRTVQIFYRTLGGVFENLESWQTESGDLLLVASHRPIFYDMDQIRARLAEEPLKSALAAAWRASSLEEFFGHYVCNSSVARVLQQLGEWRRNTDDKTVVEFALARSINLTHGFQLANLRASAKTAKGDRPLQGQGAIDWDKVEEARISMYPSVNRAEQFLATLTPEQKHRAAAFASYATGDLPGALREWRSQRDPPRTLAQLTMVAECVATEGDPSALPYIDQLAQVLPDDADAIRAELRWRDQQPAEATDTLAKFLHALHDNPWPASGLVKRSLTRADAIAKSERSRTAARILYDEIRRPFCIFINEADRLSACLSLAEYLDGERPGQNMLEALRPFEPHVLWQRKFLLGRKLCYAAMHSPLSQRAERDYNEFMKYEGSPGEVLTLTAQSSEPLSDKGSPGGPNDNPGADAHP